MDDDWKRRIAAAYGRRATGLSAKGEGLQMRMPQATVMHLIDDDAAVEAEKIKLGIQICREAAYVRRMEGREPDPGDMSCQSFFRRLLRHHRIDIARLVAMLPLNGVPIIHNRGDMPTRYLNILGRHVAHRPAATDPGMRTMPSFVIEAWSPHTITVVLSDGVVFRGGSPRMKGRATLSLLDDALPGTMRTSLIGRPVNELVRHPALKESGHMITSVTSSGRSTTVHLTSVPDTVGGLT